MRIQSNSHQKYYVINDFSSQAYQRATGTTANKNTDMIDWKKPFVSNKVILEFPDMSKLELVFFICCPKNESIITKNKQTTQSINKSMDGIHFKTRKSLFPGNEGILIGLSQPALFPSQMFFLFAIEKHLWGILWLDHGAVYRSVTVDKIDVHDNSRTVGARASGAPCEIHTAFHQNQIIPWRWRKTFQMLLLVY
jgi:hypothetical protein